MVEMYAHFPVVMWIIDALIWALGVFFWILTYIVAPLKSRKKGYTVSGFPGMAFLLFLVAGYLSPNRLLMLISLSDISVFALVIMICKGCICKRKDNEQDTYINK